MTEPFRAATDRLGVTRSTVSQSIRRLEETLGIALVRRTTRSTSLTEAGERLRSEIAPAIAEMHGAIENTRPLGKVIEQDMIAVPVRPNSGMWPSARPAISRRTAHSNTRAS